MERLGGGGDAAALGTAFEARGGLARDDGAGTAAGPDAGFASGNGLAYGCWACISVTGGGGSDKTVPLWCLGLVQCAGHCGFRARRPFAAEHW